MSEKLQALRWAMLWHSTAWLLVATVVYLSLAADMPAVPGEDSDKYGHLIAYGVMMYWFTQIYGRLRARIVIAAGLIALGIVLEFLQGYSGYRSFEYADMIANAVGVFLGWIAAPPRTPNVLSSIEKTVAS
jgi:VanZ family protein